MSERLPFLVPPYTALAQVYNRAGLASYAQHMVPRYIAYAQSFDWAGRRILDVGCGTGVSSWLLARQGYRVVGIDQSEHMLAQANAHLDDDQENNVRNSPDFVQMDMRQMESPMGLVDMVLAVGGVMNAIQSLRELELTFAQVNIVLELNRLFIFDVQTIRGLSDTLYHQDEICYDDGQGLMVLIRNQFSFETLSNTRHFFIYQRQAAGWERRDEIHVERGYPTQGIIAILERTGFQVVAVLSPELQPFDAQNNTQQRAVFVAKKQADDMSR